MMENNDILNIINGAFKSFNPYNSYNPLTKLHKRTHKKSHIKPQLWLFERNKYKKLNSSKSNKACIILDKTFTGFTDKDLYMFSDKNIFSIKGVINQDEKEYTIFDYMPIDELPSIDDNFEIIIYQDPYRDQFSFIDNIFDSIFSFDNIFIILLIISIIVIALTRPSSRNNKLLLTY